MAYDEAIGKIVIFGGLYNNLYLNDTCVAVPRAVRVIGAVERLTLIRYELSC